MATFNGEDIFGPAPIMNHDDPANAAQINHYPGVAGFERLNLARDVSYTMVSGVIAGDTPGDVGDAINAIRTLKDDATTGQLIDTDGLTWDVCLIESIRTKGRMTPAPGWGWCREYEMRILRF